MGQTASTDAVSGEESKMINSKLTRSQLEQVFIKKATSSFKPIDLFTLKSTLGVDELQANYKIHKNKLFELIGLPSDLPISDILFRSIKFLSFFPNFKDSTYDDSVTIAGLLKALSILDEEMSAEFFNNNKSFELMLLYLSFGYKFEDTTNEPKALETTDEEVDVVYINNKLQWLLTPLIQSYDGLEISQYLLQASDLLQIITFVLLISNITIKMNSTITLSSQFQFDKATWKTYEKSAFNILRSFDLELSESNYLSKTINFRTFERVIGNSVQTGGTAPNLFKPLSCYLKSLLFDRKKQSTPCKSPDISGYKILKEELLSQMATFLPSDLVFTRLRSLYTGSKFGFSIRSLESKIMKWNAPTIMLISGRYIDPIHPTKNKTFETFRSEFPKFYPSKDFQELPENPDNISKPATFMIYINKPWHISNSECIGDEGTFIAQLSPRQAIFKSSNFQSNFVYFNTLGGGVGFGSRPPLIKGLVRIYKPGEVSLTIENSIEIANFRHLAHPGTFQNGSCYNKPKPEYETWIKINELEVWGCGTEKELEEQRKMWEWENREAEARKRLNAKSWDDGKALLEMAGIVGGDSRSGGSV